RQTFKQKNPLQQSDVIANGRAAELKGSGQVTQVEQLRGTGSRHAQQAWQCIERTNAGHVTHIALHKRLDVIAVAVRSAAPPGARKGSGIASGSDTLRKLVPHPRQGFMFEALVEQAIQEARGATRQLAL